MPAQSSDFKELGRKLITHAYPELSGRNVIIKTGRLRSYGQVRWSDAGAIIITCNRNITNWPEPAVIGLLAHEISHPILGRKSSEEATDMDVIKRGLGHYLAVERAYVSKYNDHDINRNRDRYLGFQSVSHNLNNHERLIMENLLEDFNILPSKESKGVRLIHDTAIHDDTEQSIMMIEGKTIMLKGARPNSDIKMLFRGEVLFIYADDEIVAEIPWHDR
ncbi:MAG: hypothetical protein ACXADC_07405 [Candidatus Thorarchaeota archaeon]